MANEIKLTFAGDSSQLESTFNRVGGASKTMDSKVRESAGGFDRAGEAADGAEGKAQGFSDTLTGTADIGAGVGQIMKGNLFEGFVTAGQGAADLAGGMASFLIPAIQNSKIATLAKAGADKVAAGASKVWAGAQWLMNTALLASPITWIVLGVLLLVGVIILIAKKTDWFSKAWGAAWGWIKKAASNTWDWLKKIPGWIASAFSKIASSISSPFRSAFNFVADAWNNTIGRLSWTIPGWVPGIGGNSISVPNLPKFHTGGVASGAMGGEFLAVLRAGETVNASGSSSGGGVLTVQASGSGTSVERAMSEVFAELIRKKALTVFVVNGKLATSRG